MNRAAEILGAAHELYARANETTSASNATSTSTSSSDSERPASFKIIGISLAISSGAFIGTSFVLKKVGLLKANEKYNEVAGEGYGYLKNVFWWSGMTLMIIGEICNFVAYAFTDAILVTPLGALSVVITTVLSAIFLKERLSMVGKVACFLCIVGSVVIVMNAPEESSVSTIQEMQHFVIQPGFLSYTGVILIGAAATAFWAGPRWGKKNMLVYISICSWVGGLSVVATQGLGSAIVAQASGKQQFNQWFLYVLLVFVVGTLLTEIIFLNKALNLFNAALVTPTYYVYFTSTTIITSAVLFQGFKGTATSIVTVVNGFLTICSGVVLLQLSKSAKDVPDSAVFAGDLDQIQTIAEQEQPESEPKADAIRGAAALVRRFSSARQNMEVAELKRMHEEKMRERLEAVSEDGGDASNPPQYEWDGIRRRRTTIGSQRSRSHTVSSRPFTPGAVPATPHPPLGWSHVPTDEELAAFDRPSTPGMLSSIAGTIRGRGRSILLPTHNMDVEHDGQMLQQQQYGKVQSPMHPVQLTEIAVPTQPHKLGAGGGDDSTAYYGAGGDGRYGLPSGKTEYVGAGEYSTGGRDAAATASALGLDPPRPPPHLAKRQFSFQNVFRRHQQHGAAGGVDSAGGALREDEEEEETAGDDIFSARPSTGKSGKSSKKGRLSAIATARGYAAPQVKGSTEEERLGLVKGDSRSVPTLPAYDEEEDEDERAYNDMMRINTTSSAVVDEDPYYENKRQQRRLQQQQLQQQQQSSVDSTELRYGRGITGAGVPSPPRRDSGSGNGSGSGGGSGSNDEYDGRGRQHGDPSSASRKQRRKKNETTPPPPAPGGHRYSPPRGGTGAFI